MEEPTAVGLPLSLAIEQRAIVALLVTSRASLGVFWGSWVILQCVYVYRRIND